MIYSQASYTDDTLSFLYRAHRGQSIPQRFFKSMQYNITALINVILGRH